MNYTVYLVSEDDDMRRIIALYMQQKGWDFKLISSIKKAIGCISELPS